MEPPYSKEKGTAADRCGTRAWPLTFLSRYFAGMSGGK